MKAILTLVLAIFSLAAIQTEARQISCTKTQQVYEGTYPAVLTFDVGNRKGGQFKADGVRYAWTILPDGRSMMTADCDGSVCAAIYKCAFSTMASTSEYVHPAANQGESIRETINRNSAKYLNEFAKAHDGSVAPIAIRVVEGLTVSEFSTNDGYNCAMMATHNLILVCENPTTGKRIDKLVRVLK